MPKRQALRRRKLEKQSPRDQVESTAQNPFGEQFLAVAGWEVYKLKRNDIRLHFLRVDTVHFLTELQISFNALEN